VYCLLTPQSSAVNASKVVEKLHSMDFEVRQIETVEVLRHKDHYVRFHNTKARHLARAKALFPDIKQQLMRFPREAEENEVRALRAWLTQNVPGLGWKEASHFLRNIGYRNLAILDRHILRNLQRHGVIRSIPKSLSPKLYAEIEARFQAFAAEVGIDMDALDLLFWSRETGEIRK
jgi:N-glycosylase/DNA lyase